MISQYHRRESRVARISHRGSGGGPQIAAVGHRPGHRSQLNSASHQSAPALNQGHLAVEVGYNCEFVAKTVISVGNEEPSPSRQDLGRRRAFRLGSLRTRITSAKAKPYYEHPNLAVSRDLRTA